MRRLKMPSDFYSRIATFKVKVADFYKKSRLFKMSKNRDFFQGKSRQGEKVATFSISREKSPTFTTLHRIIKRFRKP